MTDQIKSAEVKYNRDDRIYAVICAALGYLFVRSVFFLSMGLGAFIFTLAVICAGIWRLRASGAAPRAGSYAFVALIAAYSCCYITNTNEFIHTLCLLCTFFMYLLWIMKTAAGDDIITDNIVADMLRAVIVFPLRKFFSLFGALFASRGEENQGDKKKRIAHILLGLALSALPCAAVIRLLSSADEAFSNLVSSFSFELNTKAVEQLIYILLALPAALFIFGALRSGLLARSEGKNDAASAPNLKKARPATILSATLPLLGVYMLYFFSQLSYFTSAFAGYLPNGWSAADYARRGFFELCAVAVINAAVIFCISCFSAEDDKIGKITVRALNIAFALCTLVLIATALSKMVMYMSFFGLTQKRIYTSWFMLLLAAAFIFVIIRQLSASFKFTRTLFITFAVMFAVLIFPDYDALIAQSSVADVVSADTVAELDVLSDSPGVIETLIGYTKNPSSEVRDAAKLALEHLFYRLCDENGIYNGDLLCYNIAKMRSAAMISAEMTA